MSDEVERLRRRVDELEATAAALRESEARLSVLFERAPDAYYLSDLKGVFLDGNEAAEKLCGYPRDDLVGKSFLELDLLSPVDVPRAAMLLAKNALGQPTGPDEFTLRRKGGESVIVEIHTIPVILEGRRTVLGIARDLTKRRAAETALGQSEARRRRAAAAGKVGAWEWEMGTGAMYVDPILKELLGYRDDEIRNHIDDWGALVHPEDVDAVMRAADAHLNGETELYEVAHRMVHKDGSIRWFLARGSVIRDDEGEPVRMVGSDVDITEQKLAEADRLRLEADARDQRNRRLESLGMLAGGIAHDFNNLLTTILGHAGMALVKLPADEPARKMVEKIEEAANAASDLTGQLLTYSGKGRTATGPTDLNRVIEETTALIDVSIPKNVTLAYELGKDVPSIEADEAQLRQVVMNLVINAAEALAGASGEIHIRTGTDPDPHFDDFVDKPPAPGPFAFVEVSDNGAGMSDETRARIFDPFFTTKFTGRGLGLAAVRGIVRAHRGGIRLDSEPGRGTSVRALFRVTEVGAVEPRREPAAAGREQPAMCGSVLIVDDEANVRDVVRSMLEDVGLDVVTASSGTDAIDVFRRHRDVIHAVVLDVTMPDLNGEETLDRIRRFKPDVPVLLMSGYDDGSAACREDSSRGVAFVQKPFRQHEILARLSEIWPTGLG